jgi:Spy/CpxP family protein refolding chaperone
MKKIIALALTASIISTGFSQEMTSQKVNNEANAQKAKDDKAARAEIMNSLNLSDDQKQKMKNNSSELKKMRTAIESDTTLSADAKKEKLKDLRKLQEKNTKDILTPEQYEKLQQAKKDMAKPKSGE